MKPALRRAVEEGLLGTCGSVDTVAELYGVDRDRLLEAASELGVERCEDCDWWVDDFGESDDIVCVDCCNDREARRDESSDEGD